MNSKDHIIQQAEPFVFKQFSLEQDEAVMKVGTDGILLGAWVDTSGVSNILDIGTGTGLIALMCMQKNDQARVDAIDISEQAYQLALRNATNSPWPGQVELFHTSLQDFAAVTDRRYDLIVSNPPFFSGGTFSEKENRNLIRHTVKLPNGDLLQAARRLLKPEGRLCVILPYIEGLRFEEHATRYGLYATHKVAVLPTADKPVERWLLQLEKQSRPLQSEEMIVHGPNGYSPEYIALTRAFYRDL